MKEPRAEVLDTCRTGASQTEDTLERMETELAAEERRLASALATAEASSDALRSELRALESAVGALRARRGDDESAALLREVQKLAAPAFEEASVRTPWHVARAAAAARRRGACEAVKANLEGFVRAKLDFQERLGGLRGRVAALATRPVPEPEPSLPVEGEVSELEMALSAAASAHPAPLPPPPPSLTPVPTPPVEAPAQRRSHPRCPLVTRVDVDTDSNFFGGFSTDVSEGGLFVATIAYPAPGTTIDLRFTLPGGFIVQTAGVVQWVREVNDATPEVMPGAGVRFVDLPESAAEAIRAFVAKRERLFFVD